MVKSQKKWNYGFTAFMTMLFLLILQVSVNLALIFALGTALGFTLQKSRFCFVAALRDPMVTGITELTQAVILLTGLSILGFGMINYISFLQQRPIFLNVFPVGYHTIVGGILFGIGMVIAGGCVSGILMRIGEGFAMQIVALFGLLIGALIANQTQGFWQGTFGEWGGIYLPDLIGWFPALVIQLLVLAGLWQLARWWQKRTFGE
jgi:uncharacterized protein